MMARRSWARKWLADWCIPDLGWHNMSAECIGRLSTLGAYNCKLWCSCSGKSLCRCALTIGSSENLVKTPCQCCWLHALAAAEEPSLQGVCSLGCLDVAESDGPNSHPGSLSFRPQLIPTPNSFPNRCCLDIASPIGPSVPLPAAKGEYPSTHCWAVICGVQERKDATHPARCSSAGLD
jgi:hypothetical protein